LEAKFRTRSNIAIISSPDLVKVLKVGGVRGHLEVDTHVFQLSATNREEEGDNGIPALAEQSPEIPHLSLWVIIFSCLAQTILYQ
jgi:hypothetical protein